MANRDKVQAWISKDMDALLINVSKQINQKMDWKSKPVSKVEASRYIAKLINLKGPIILKKVRGKRQIDMNLPFDLYAEV